MRLFLCYPRIKSVAIVFILLFVANAQQTPTQADHGIVVADLDSSVKPGDNFYANLVRANIWDGCKVAVIRRATFSDFRVSTFGR